MFSLLIFCCFLYELVVIIYSKTTLLLEKFWIISHFEMWKTMLSLCIAYEYQYQEVILLEAVKGIFKNVFTIPLFNKFEIINWFSFYQNVLKKIVIKRLSQNNEPGLWRALTLILSVISSQNVRLFHRSPFVFET